ncbi:MAG: GHKL domain-containing protein, partial [Anaerolineaceae bacterium]|nr:GHKL domain-containing protein [Anaerolineaceae bacterium]
RGIAGYSQLLLEDYQEQLDEDGQRFLRSISKSTEYMNQLIADLLAYSRLDRDKISLSEIDLNQLVSGIIESIESSRPLDGSQVERKIDIQTAPLLTDKNSLTIALRNLIDNAYKFSEKQTAPRIEIHAEQRAESVFMWIKDNGIGFDMKYQQRIFELFQRLNRLEDYPGTGIGLALVQKSVFHMGGKVWAESQPGQGATFYLEFPRRMNHYA